MHSLAVIRAREPSGTVEGLGDSWGWAAWAAATGAPVETAIPTPCLGQTLAVLSDDELLDQIEQKMLESAPLPDVLRMLLLLGGRLGFDAPRDWAKARLDAYGPTDDFPEVRNVGGPYSWTRSEPVKLGLLHD